MRLKTLILHAVISIGILTTKAHAQSFLTTDKQFYVTNSDTDGTAWVDGGYPTPPVYSDGTGQTFTFYTWYYYWGDDGSGGTDQAYADLSISTRSQSEDDKHVSLGLVPSYTADCDGTEVYGDSIDIAEAYFTVCEIKSTTVVNAPDGTDDGREIVGVGERVNLVFTPDDVHVTWSSDGDSEGIDNYGISSFCMDGKNRFDGGCAPPNPAPLAAAGVRGESGRGCPADSAGSAGAVGVIGADTFGYGCKHSFWNGAWTRERVDGREERDERGRTATQALAGLRGGLAVCVFGVRGLLPGA